MASRKKPQPTEEQRESSGPRRGRVENLKPFKPGQSGNPGGKRKGQSLTAKIAAILERDTLGGKRLPGGLSVADVLAEAIVKQACLGKFPFAKEVLERLDGKVPDRIIDETPDADADRERSEFDAILASLRERGGGAPAPTPRGTPVPGRDGDGDERGEMDAGPAPGAAE
jgi:hypothetical protein